LLNFETANAGNCSRLRDGWKIGGSGIERAGRKIFCGRMKFFLPLMGVAAAGRVKGEDGADVPPGRSLPAA
jgi:hypothetical protein